MSNEKNEKERLQKRKVFLESLAKGTSIVTACKASNIAVVTIWRWRKEKDFNDEVLAIFESRTQVAEDALYKNVIRGNVIAQIFYLKNRDSARWKDKQEYEHSGEIGYRLLDCDISKYPKAKDAVSVPTKDKRAKKGD